MELQISYCVCAKVQAKIAETVGTSPQYVSRLINNQENIVNKTFLSMMEALGYDVELTYVKKED